MKVTVAITRRPEIADPQGTTVRRALHDLGFAEVDTVRFDRLLTLEVDGSDSETIRQRVEEMCERLLANPVLEDFVVEVDR
ncbi:MAG: phosphoribosylformylglycinamidine synthase subunit PurS [Acidimicrobiia bacterium]|nr:phosphoribosylformylglycinamidine synthase subunit PurS [Acidimicrobiia bacterium]MDQ3499418.1 phosphoribosylformylglycinamidine synthase subunit PurS [Actinomycetota bacterium]